MQVYRYKVISTVVDLTAHIYNTIRSIDIK